MISAVGNILSHFRCLNKSYLLFNALLFIDLMTKLIEEQITTIQENHNKQILEMKNQMKLQDEKIRKLEEKVQLNTSDIRGPIKSYLRINKPFEKRMFISSQLFYILVNLLKD